MWMSIYLCSRLLKKGQDETEKGARKRAAFEDKRAGFPG
jgi:hypothetical protein